MSRKTARRPDGSIGFLCTCGHKMGVTDSRPVPHGGIRRRRYCPACKAKCTTYEVRAEHYSEASGIFGIDAIKVRVQRISEDIAVVSAHVVSMADVADSLPNREAK